MNNWVEFTSEFYWAYQTESLHRYQKTYLYIVVTSNLPGILDHGSIDEINTLPRILDHGPTDEINTLPRILDHGSTSLLLAPWGRFH